ncbi:MAG: low molecular weight phosphotyrosine protein phosphatase [Ruminococcaceae bacterium]|nr:low molecular weight phosphotyrosine protein phosphatase [Oscillospiraceae bacterium]
MANVLFLCHGNICRSPMAEFVFRRMAGERVHCESKAVSAEEIGNDMYPAAAAMLRQKGVPFGRHRARQITKADYDAFDYIVVMEEYNLPRLFRIIGSDPAGKVHRLLDFTDTPDDIEDPWYSGNFEKVYEQIERGCAALLQKITKEGR